MDPVWARNRSSGENEDTLIDTYNYATDLFLLERFEEVKQLLRKSLPVARRVLGEGNETTLKMRWHYAMALYKNEAATPDDLSEAVMTLEDTARVALRVLGGAHPTTAGIEDELRDTRAALRARRNVELRAAAKEDPSSLSADDRARAEQLLARDARKAAKKKAARGGDSH